MKIAFSAPGGETISFDAPEDATADAIQSEIDSLQKQYLEHYSPSQLRLKTGKPLVTSELKSPTAYEAGKQALVGGAKELISGVKGITHISTPEELAQPQELLPEGSPARKIFEGGMSMVNTLPAAAGQGAMNVTGSPLLATGVQLATPLSPLGVAKGLGRAATAYRARGTAEVAGGLESALSEITPPKKASPPPVMPVRTPAEIGASALDLPATTLPVPIAAKAKGKKPAVSAPTIELEDWVDLSRSMFDEAPPTKVRTQSGRRGKVIRDEAGGRAVVAGDDGITTTEAAHTLSLDEIGPTVPEARAAGGKVGAKLDETQALINRLLEGETPPARLGATRFKSQAAQEAELEVGFRAQVERSDVPSDRAYAEQLSAEVNAQKPSRAEALHATEAEQVGLRPAIKVGGKVIAGEVGQVHNDVLEKMPAVQEAVAKGKLPEADTHGYVDASGKFLSRKEATDFVGTSEDVLAAQGEQFVPEAAKVAPAKPVARRRAVAPKAVPVPELPSDPGLAPVATSHAELRQRFNELARGGKLDEAKAVAAQLKALGPEPKVPTPIKPAALEAKPVAAAPAAEPFAPGKKPAKPRTKVAAPVPPAIPELARAWEFEKRRDPKVAQADFVYNIATGQIPYGLAPAEELIYREAHEAVKSNPAFAQIAKAAATIAGTKPAVAPPLVRPSAEVRAMLPEANRVASDAVKTAHGLTNAVEPNIGDRVSTAKGEGLVEDLSIGTSGELIAEVRLTNGQLHKTPYVFKALTSEKGAFVPTLVPDLAKALATRAVNAARIISQEVRRGIAPGTISKEGQLGSRILRRALGETNAYHSKLEHLLTEVDTFYDRFSNAELVHSYQRMHNGTPQVGPHAKELDQLAATFRGLLARKEAEYARHGWGLDVKSNLVASLFKDTKRASLFADIATARSASFARITRALNGMMPPERQQFFLNMMGGHPQASAYLTGMSDERLGPFFKTFKDPNNAQRTFNRFYGPNGVAGSKKAHYDFFAEGLLSELEPHSYSPARLVQSRLYQMEKGLMLNKLFELLKPEMKLSRLAERKPDGYDAVKFLPALTTRQAKNYNVLGPAAWYAPSDIARIINNELQPGLRGNKLYDLARDTTMLQTMSRLGVSYFHAVDITLGSVQTAVGDAVQMLVNDHTLRGFKELPKTLVPYNIGKRAREEFFKNWDTGNPIDQTLQYLIQSNVRTGHDEQYAQHFIRAWDRALAQHDYGKATLNAFPAMLQAISRPMFETLIPNIKIGADIIRAQRVLEKLPPGAKLDTILEKMSSVVDEGDNIFGAVNYQNYHLPKWAKDALFVTFQAPGWFLGSARQYFGAGGELGTTAKDLLSGRGFKIGSKTAFWLGTGLVDATFNSLMQFALTGTFPEVVRPESPSDVPQAMLQTIKNFVTYKTGRTLANGEPERAIAPGYTKEFAHLTRALTHGVPGVLDYMSSKLAATWQDAYYQAFNRDWTGTEIATPANWLDVKGRAKNLNERAMYELKANTPISLQTMAKSARSVGEIPFRANRTKLDTAKDIVGAVVQPTRPVHTARNLLGSLFGAAQAPAYMTRSKLTNFLFEQKRTTAGRSVEKAEAASQKYDLTNAMRRAKTVQERAQLQREAAKDKQLSQHDITEATKHASMSSIQLATEHASLEVMLKGMEYASPEERRELLPIIIKRWNNVAQNLSPQKRQQLQQQLSAYMPQRRQ